MTLQFTLQQGSSGGSTVVEQHHMRRLERHTWDRNITLGNSFPGKAPSLWNEVSSPSQGSYQKECVSPRVFIFNFKDLTKKKHEPQPPFLWPCGPLQCMCLLMPSQDGDVGCFMNGDIWEAVNTANVKIDVWVGSFRVADRAMEAPFQRVDSSS